ncbi:glycoside hydrolase family 5 protein [Pseudohyphozyma bogoriensis]|nr:glycoside hydrolase family 5 protein [Pseudohyphozyma bogoriensis]
MSTSFVKRDGHKLMLDGEEYRIVGPNIYWLGLDENVVPSPSYPAKSRVREAFAMSVAMGANTVRSGTLGISTGNALSVWPINGQTNEAAFESIDYAIYAAKKYGIRLIITLTDHGGKYDFIGWAGLNTSDGNNFYAEKTTTIFKSYISTLLTHKNQFTGLAYKDDPTILAWETGNELGAYDLQEGAPPANWTDAIAKHIKSLAPNHLVIDGTNGLVDSNGVMQTHVFNTTYTDFVSDHFYPTADWLLTKDEGMWEAQTNLKSYLVGEMDWTGSDGGDSLADFYTILNTMGGSGSMIWSLFGHDEQCCNWVTHDDGYSLYYPNGNNPSLYQKIDKVVNCPQPEF